MRKKPLLAVKSFKWLLTLVLIFTMIPTVFADTMPANTGKEAKHPLDPLSEGEISSVLEILKEKGYYDQALRFPVITLKEPDKEEVWNWNPGKAFSRRAFIIAKQGKRVFEGVVDITAKKVVSWEEIKGVQPMLLAEEWTAAQEIVVNDPRWQERAKKRGITDFSKVICVPLTVGYFGPSENEDKRLVKVPSFLETGDGNFWAHPIEGLTAVVDLDAKKVIEIEDTGVLPIPKEPAGVHKPAVDQKREKPAPLMITQPQGPSFKVNGHQVSWQNWKLHFRVEPREGLVISAVTFNDKGKERKILYRGSLGGMIVPYGDPSPGWYFRTYMDAGEYGVGKLAASQEVGIDSPENASYFDVTLADDYGKPYTVPRAVAIFERYGGPEWRHTEPIHGTVDARSRRELVIRFIAVIGNYDYIFDWIFQQNGTIEIAVGASGIEQVKAVNSTTLAYDVHGKDTLHGTLVGPHTVAVHHQHIYNFRLDLDVDGVKNSFVRLDPKAVPVQGSPRKSAMIVEEKTFKTEQEAQQKYQPMSIPLFINPNMKNDNGYHVGYQINPMAVGTHPFVAEPLFTPDEWVLKRAGFAKNHIWVTPYDSNEMYPEGDYPNQSKTDTGLGKWIEQNRSIENTDDVLWVTTGTTHIVRAEEWPVLPTEWAMIMLKPFNFFDNTPTLDLPEENHH